MLPRDQRSNTHALQLRQKRLKAARTILGLAIGKAAKPKIFKYYIDLETQLAQVCSRMQAFSELVHSSTCAR
jgi:hypothetical protein